MGLTPARRRGVEVLDDPDTPTDVRQRSMSDVVRANTLFGGTRSALRALRDVWPLLPRDAVLLDVGTGLADIPARARREARRAGISLTAVGLDASESTLRSAVPLLSGAVVGDATRLPVRDYAADVVICSQLLHHFTEHDARRVIAELHRVSRGWVVISDLRRSRLAAAGFWIASTILRFHPVTRHDGVVSVFRGLTVPELRSLIREATGVEPAVRRGIFWRLSATWPARAR
jgi:SAM-dependent methyltransferase